MIRYFVSFVVHYRTKPMEFGNIDHTEVGPMTMDSVRQIQTDLRNTAGLECSGVTVLYFRRWDEP